MTDELPSNLSYGNSEKREIVSVAAEIAFGKMLGMGVRDARQAPGRKHLERNYFCMRPNHLPRERPIYEWKDRLHFLGRLGNSSLTQVCRNLGLMRARRLKWDWGGREFWAWLHLLYDQTSRASRRSKEPNPTTPSRMTLDILRRGGTMVSLAVRHGTYL